MGHGGSQCDAGQGESSNTIGSTRWAVAGKGLKSSVSCGHVKDDLAWLALRGLAVARGETFSSSATKTNALRNIAGRNSILNLAVNAMYAA